MRDRTLMLHTVTESAANLRRWRRDGETLVCILLVAVLVATVSGCDGNSASTEAATRTDTPAATSVPGAVAGVRARVVQQRIDEGTRRIGVQVTTDANTSLHVVGVQLRSPGFRTVPATPKDTRFAPGQTIDLTTTYGDPVCGSDVDPAEDLTALLTVRDHRGGAATGQVPITGRGVAFIRRLHTSECAEQNLRTAAPPVYTGRFTRASVDGTVVLAGTLTLRRPENGSGEPVAIDALTGSVLFAFETAEPVEPGRPVARLAPTDDVLRVPVQIGSSGRCDEHARSQSTQTFLFSAFVRVGAEPVYRKILVPPPGLQRRALTLLDDVCASD